MRFDNRSSSLQLLKLALGSARFSTRRLLTGLSLILLLTAGSLYITNQIYQHQKIDPLLTDEAGSKEKIKPSQKAKKQPAASKPSVRPQSFHIPLEIRQERRRKAITRLKLQLRTSALNELKKDAQLFSEALRQKNERQARLDSILSHSDEAAKLQLQDQRLHSENDLYSPSPEEEETPPPPPEQESNFWKELQKEFYEVLKEFLKKFI
jgi:hypothetical protein